MFLKLKGKKVIVVIINKKIFLTSSAKKLNPES